MCFFPAYVTTDASVRLDEEFINDYFDMNSVKSRELITAVEEEVQ